MEDNRDIAFLAASLEREMRQSLLGSSGMRYNRTDFRQFLGPQGGHPQQYPQPQQQQYPQHGPNVYPPQMVQQYPPQYNPNNVPVDMVAPDGVLPPSNAHLVPLPQQYVQYAQPHQQGVRTDGMMEPVDSFQVPNYNQPSKSYLEDEQEFRDALIKEVKSQKKTINKLSRQVDELILLFKELSTFLNPQAVSQSKPETIIVDDTSDQS